jgi:biotin synthase
MIVSAKLRAVCESPDYVRTSTAAAMTMGFTPGRFYRDARLYCVNLLLTYEEGCSARCAYCGLSEGRLIPGHGEDQSFIRVDWPIVPLDDVIKRLGGDQSSHVERVCVSMITNLRARDDTLDIVARLKPAAERISVLITPTIVDEGWLRELKLAGADMVGIAVDAATPELFDKLRGSGVGGPHDWGEYWRTLGEAVTVFGRMNASIHLIVGVGETEREMVDTMAKAHGMGARVHLFSFFPEERSQMEDHPQPPMGQYRRIQLARYLIEHDLAESRAITFDGDGRITGFGVPAEKLESIVDLGLPFMTSGCPGRTMENACNRPFANDTPAQAEMGLMRNFPFQPDEEDIRRVKAQLR